MSNLLEGFKKHGPLLVFLAVIVVCIGYGYIIWSTDWTSNNKIGDFGESFGAIDALFAGLAFAVLIYTILLQKAELQLQREELQAQRETLQKQNFESSFFQLLGLHNEIVNSMEFKRIINEEAVTYSGRKCFVHMLSELNEGVSYEDFFAEYQLYVGHYFRHLYNIIKFVDENEFLENLERQQFYTNLIRAQLSTDELGVLFYHGLSEPGAEFKDMIEEYALFEGMRDVFQNVEIDDQYAARAYG